MRIYVPSLSRAGNVAAMTALAGDAELVWLVPPEQADAYAAAGAEQIITGPPGKCDKINAVLDAHGDEWTVFSDDDCRGMVRLDGDGVVRPITLGEAAAEYVELGERRHDPCVFIPCLRNQRFLNRAIANWGMTTGWFFAIAPGIPQRFDPTLAMCEDLDFPAQCFDAYGRICRPGWIMGSYRMGDSTSHYRAAYADLALCGGTQDILLHRYPHLFEYRKGRFACRQVTPPGMRRTPVSPR